MELANYLDELRNGQRGWQDEIVLPETLVTFFNNLYETTEAEGGSTAATCCSIDPWPIAVGECRDTYHTLILAADLGQRSNKRCFADIWRSL